MDASEITPPLIKVLFAEDNLALQKPVVHFLERQGCTVTCVGNGKAVLTNLAGDGSFDVVLLDCNMPVLDGFQTATAIRTSEQGTGRHIAIIAVTALTLPGMRDECLRAGMDEYLTKPVSLGTLKETIDRLVAKRGKRSP